MSNRNTTILCKPTSVRRSTFTAFCLALLATGVGVLVAGDTKPAQTIQPTPKLCEAIRGSFDMSKNPRPWIGFMIMDQVGNPYPSFWCGGNAGGTIVFAAKIDDLDETFGINQTGSFSVDLVHTARKHGMFDELPGGAWMGGGKVTPIRVTFEKFTDPAITAFSGGPAHQKSTDEGHSRGFAGGTVDLATKCSGTIEVGSRKAPFSGTAKLSFMRDMPSFSFCTTFQIPGKELGLLGSKGEGITATLYTASVSVLNTPGGKGGFGGDSADDQGNGTRKSSD